MSSIGERLKLVRGKRSGEEFATFLGVHLQTLYRYERGERTPDIDFVQLVSNKENISIEWLISGKGTMHGEGGSYRPPWDDSQSIDKRIERLEAKLDKTEQQRDDLMTENRQLWKENGQLREKVARLEEAAHKPGIFNESAASSGAA